MATNGKPTAMQREKFRKFVERSGIVELVTRTLVELYEERLTDPDEALDFFRSRIAASAVREAEAVAADDDVDVATPKTPHSDDS